MAVRILVDSTFDFTEEQLRELGLDVVRMRVHFGNEEFIDGLNITPREFYERLVESDTLPTTSQATPADFAEHYEKLTANGDQVVAMTISSALSGTYQSAVIAAEDFPGRVRVVDTLERYHGRADTRALRPDADRQRPGHGRRGRQTGRGEKAHTYHRPAGHARISQARRTHIRRRRGRGKRVLHQARHHHT